MAYGVAVVPALVVAYSSVTGDQTAAAAHHWLDEGKPGSPAPAAAPAPAPAAAAAAAASLDTAVAAAAVADPVNPSSVHAASSTRKSE